MSVPWPALVELVRKHESFLLTSHIRPDCDALGSELGMAGILESLGKKVRIVNGHPTPPNLTFIDPERRIETLGEQVQASELGTVDVMMVLDTKRAAQLGPMGDVLRSIQAKRKVIFDHHVGEDDLGAESFKDVTAEATGRLVAEAAEHLGVPLTERIATPLFAALATDTGWFRFSSAKEPAYRCAAKLVAAGARPDAIYASLYEQDTLPRMRLRGRILERIVMERDGVLAHTNVRLEDFSELHAHPSDTEDVVNSLLAIKGVRVAVIFVEQPGGAFKISFRSRCATNCNEVASKFGGGGHKAAAGATVRGSLDEVRPRVLDAVRAALP